MEKNFLRSLRRRIANEGMDLAGFEKKLAINTRLALAWFEIVQEIDPAPERERMHLHHKRLIEAYKRDPTLESWSLEELVDLTAALKTINGSTFTIATILEFATHKVGDELNRLKV